MKKITVLFSIFAALGVTAQSVSDYKYVYIAPVSKEFQKNDYKLPAILKSQLTSKQYIVIQDENGVIPEILATNPCSVAKAEIVDNSNMMRNRILVRFTDCQNRVLSENKGTSMIKDFDTGFPDALRNSLKDLASSQPNEANQPKGNVVAAATLTPAKTVTQQPSQITESTPVQAQSTTQVVTSAVAPGVQAYIFNGKNYQKVQLGNDQFILVSNESTVPFATFKNTSKADVYRVQLGDGTSTFGYLQDGNLVIETTDSNGKPQNIILQKR